MGRDACRHAAECEIPVSIHAPRVGRDLQSPRPARPIMRFQFTRPAWGATIVRFIPPPAGLVSIHAPRVGRDRRPRSARPRSARFNSRAPRGARRVLIAFRAWGLSVSIHAPRVGRDTPPQQQQSGRHSFNSRAPRGARHMTVTVSSPFHTFQFTRPAWGATWARRRGSRAGAVSIHAPRVGRDTLPTRRRPY